MTIILFKGEQIVRVFRESQLPGKFMDILGFAYSGETDFFRIDFASEAKNGRSDSASYQFPGDFDRVSIQEAEK